MLKCNKKNCTGCGACNYVCPFGAIEMIKNKDGFLYPDVDKNKCKNCDICNKTCPALVKKSDDNESFSYIAQLKNKDDLMRSASGGAFYGLAKQVINCGGVVFGVSNYNMDLKYLYVDKVEDLYKLQGSKYCQCNITKNDFNLINKFSKERLVLVSGTPCQMSAIKNISKINKKNIFTVEILCQGVPSQTVIDKYNSFKEKKEKKKIINHYYRSKDKYVGRNYLNKYVFEDNTIKYYVGEEDELSLSFQRQIFLRESCYKCKYANEKRVSDFVIGDLWNKEIIPSKINAEKGVSFIICTNEKSNNIFGENIYFNKVKTNLNNIVHDNIPFHHPVKKPFARFYSYNVLNLSNNPILTTKLSCYKYYLKKIIRSEKNK